MSRFLFSPALVGAALMLAQAAIAQAIPCVATLGRETAYIDMQTLTSSNGGLGCAYLPSTGFFYTSHRGNGATTAFPHTIYVWDNTGALVSEFGQPIGTDSSAWGLRDGVTASDPSTYLGVVAILAAVGLAACYLPAREGSRVDPMTVLRTD